MILLVLFIVFSSFVGLVALAFLIRSSILRLKVDNITSRYVFITGCDTGFGNLLTQMLDAKGVSVFAGCLTHTGARDLSDKTSSRVQTVLLDVTDKESVTKAYEIVKSKLPHDTGLWGLVNNAGIMPAYSPIEWQNTEEFENVCKVNLFGSISVTLTFLPLIRQTNGRIVNVCSVVSNVGIPGVANYCVSKAGVKMFTTCLRRELFQSDISIHTIEPGGFDTSICDGQKLANSLKMAYERAPEDLKPVYGGNISRFLFGNMKHRKKVISSKIHQVPEAMMHALLARHPKLEYAVGLDATFFFKPLVHIPTWIQDVILSWPKHNGPLAEELLA